MFDGKSLIQGVYAFLIMLDRLPHEIHLIQIRYKLRWCEKDNFKITTGPNERFVWSLLFYPKYS